MTEIMLDDVFQKPDAVAHPKIEMHYLQSAAKIRFGAKHDNPAFWKYVDKTIRLIDLDLRKRKRSVREEKFMRQTVGDILLALYKAQTHGSSVVRINLDKNFYFRDWKPPFFPGYRFIKSAYDGLKKLGLIAVVWKGYQSENDFVSASFCTRIKASDRLMDSLSFLNISTEDIKYPTEEKGVVLREAVKVSKKRGRGCKTVKRDIKYPKTTAIKKMNGDIQELNALYEVNHIDVELKDDEFNALQKELCQEGKIYTCVDLDDKSVRRIFNEDFKHGGRFYGAWWMQIGSKWRRYIKINGNSTVEMDYRSLHPTLLYKRVNRPMPRNPYDIGFDEKFHAYMKPLFNALLNAKEGQRIGQPYKKSSKKTPYSVDQMGMKWKDLTEAVMNFHHPIKRYFRTGIGLELQNLDAKIANFILMKFTEERIVCLSIHDSFIVESQHAEKLKALMEEATLKFAGTKIGIKITEGYSNRQNIRDIIRYGKQEYRNEEDKEFYGYSSRFRDFILKEKGEASREGKEVSEN